MSDPAAVPDSGAFNPYSAPEEMRDPADPTSALSTRDQRCLTIGRVLVTWEKLRILYNAILGVEALFVFFVGWRAAVHFDDIVITIGVGALTANVCFCLGPLMDGYLSWFGLRSYAITACLYVVGLGIAVLLGGILMLALAAPDW